MTSPTRVITIHIVFCFGVRKKRGRQNRVRWHPYRWHPYGWWWLFSFLLSWILSDNMPYRPRPNLFISYIVPNITSENRDCVVTAICKTLQVEIWRSTSETITDSWAYDSTTISISRVQRLGMGDFRCRSSLRCNLMLRYRRSGLRYQRQFRYIRYIKL